MPRLPSRENAPDGDDEDVEYKAVGEGEEESSDEECDDAMDEDAGENKGASKRPEVWRPSGAEDEAVELEYDETAYDA